MGFIRSSLVFRRIRRVSPQRVGALVHAPGAPDSLASSARPGRTWPPAVKPTATFGRRVAMSRPSWNTHTQYCPKHGPRRSSRAARQTRGPSNHLATMALAGGSLAGCWHGYGRGVSTPDSLRTPLFDDCLRLRSAWLGLLRGALALLPFVCHVNCISRWPACQASGEICFSTRGTIFACPAKPALTGPGGLPEGPAIRIAGYKGSRTPKMHVSVIESRYSRAF